MALSKIAVNRTARVVKLECSYVIGQHSLKHLVLILQRVRQCQIELTNG